MEKLPDGWKRVKLGEVLEETKERNHRNLYFNVFTISNNSGLILQDEFFGRLLASKNTRNYKIVRYLHFAYNPARINVGSIALNETSLTGIISPMYIVFKTHKDKLIPKFFKYYTQTKRFNNQVISNTAGSVREVLNYSALMTFDFLLPPLPEQQKIAEILETVDNAIEKTDKIIEKYKRIKQGLMQELLTKGIDEEGNIRSEKTHKFKDSPVGRIPVEWEVVKLGEVIKYEQPWKYIVRNEKYDPKHGVPVLTAGKTFILGYTDETTGIYENVPAIIFDDFTTESRFVNFPFKVKSSALKILKPANNNINLFFVFNLLQTITLKPGSEHKRFWISEYSKIDIPFPPFPEQQRIAEILSQVDKAIEKEQNYKEKLRRLKQGLMEDLLTGKVRVNNLIEVGKNDV
ncbi:restriction endonuclease subunit S [Hydrogenobacter sp. T-2]|uniref:restriction endonuclease subunit S n=1 Tax=Pampinifervens diazotrophicum TaxID=1632018 RepID=UPI002B261050|nr:restriction endonuclease subunit S [Hydrogenobacter sp. T-2]WPM31199.1 restriction endonuclease subunit S [Hydrogenobacter sp. T-2]